ncbi:MAG: uroporphyrinogen-III C-methyltransferase [Cyanobacterium sp. T60_A2020_053]|nr:uroporphyrinogen-III C-methyltransferase [Cyanobacterium sp. T60_A2020_053]
MTVYLTGAGIGGIDYLTVKAYRLIQKAEVIIYDALVDESILSLAPSTAIKIPVGKRGGKFSTPQSRINKILTEYALKYDIVIRLKSGDPAIFGRINPEISALHRINASVELIPGISSVLGAPLLAGITLTEKNLSKNFTVISGHDADNLDWHILSKLDTLIILMGGKNLPIIIEKLLENQRPSTQPITIIKNAGRSNQQIWYSNLGNVINETANIQLSPSVIVIGDMARMQNEECRMQN